MAPATRAFAGILADARRLLNCLGISGSGNRSVGIDVLENHWPQRPHRGDGRHFAQCRKFVRWSRCLIQRFCGYRVLLLMLQALRLLQLRVGSCRNGKTQREYRESEKHRIQTPVYLLMQCLLLFLGIMGMARRRISIF